MPEPGIDFSDVERFGRKIGQVASTLTLKERNKIVRESASRVSRHVKLEAPRKTGNLRRSIARKKWTRWPVYLVGPRYPKGAHGGLLEEGTSERITRTGARRGSVAPRRWFSKAVNAVAAAEVRKIGGDAAETARRKFSSIARGINRGIG